MLARLILLELHRLMLWGVLLKIKLFIDILFMHQTMDKHFLGDNLDLNFFSGTQSL